MRLFGEVVQPPGTHSDGRDFSWRGSLQRALGLLLYPKAHTSPVGAGQGQGAGLTDFGPSCLKGDPKVHGAMEGTPEVNQMLSATSASSLSLRAWQEVGYSRYGAGDANSRGHSFGGEKGRARDAWYTHPPQHSQHSHGAVGLGGPHGGSGQGLVSRAWCPGLIPPLARSRAAGGAPGQPQPQRTGDLPGDVARPRPGWDVGLWVGLAQQGPRPGRAVGSCGIGAWALGGLTWRPGPRGGGQDREGLVVPTGPGTARSKRPRQRRTRATLSFFPCNTMLLCVTLGWRRRGLAKFLFTLYLAWEQTG